MGHSCAASLADSSWVSTPNTFANDAWRRMWVRRSALVAMLRLPVLIHPVDWPVSFSRAAYSSAL
jgi:hypothetical protein